MPRLIALAAALVVASVVATVVVYGRLHASSLSAQPPSTGIPPVRMRRPVPPFTATSLTGARISDAEFHGRPLVINFFASWCPPCRQDAPRIAAIAARYRGRVQVLGVDGGDTRTGALRFLRRYGWRFPIVWDPSNRLYRPFGVAAQPVTFIVDAHGLLVERFLGPVDLPAAQATLNRLLRT
jgi:cytochrome c biogenesis protein CcmG, thiol:disulfide interchange protein DsbE